MLTWLRLVLDRLDSQRNLLAAYTVLFHFLDYDTLRYCRGQPPARSPVQPRGVSHTTTGMFGTPPCSPVLCQILYKTTRKQHVLGFRCRRL